MDIKSNIKLLTYFQILVLFILIFGVYSGFVFLTFSKVDDGWMLLNNELVPHFSMSFTYLLDVFTQQNDIQYSPLNTLYYAVIYQIDGYNPFVYHFFSIFIHFLNSILVYTFFKKILIDKESKAYAYFLAVLWGIHPLNVESVVWISASKVLLFSFFSLLALNLITRERKNQFIHILKINLALIAACFCKEQAVLIAFVLIFVDLSLGKVRAFSKGKIFEYLSYILVASVFVYVTYLFNVDSMAHVSHSFIERVILSFYSLFWYSANTVMPLKLHYHYDFPFLSGEIIPLYYYAFIVFWVYICYFVIKNRIYRSHSFKLVVCAIILISASLHIVPMARKTLFADRYMYLSTLFLIPVFFNLLKSIRYKNLVIYFFVAYYSIYSYYLVFQWFNLNYV